MKLKNFTGKISDSDIRLLRIFCTVVRCGGFAAAESELQLGLPSISRYVKDLEIRLGVRLCQRGRTGFSLTEEGRQVYASSLQLISHLEQFEASIRGIHTDIRGTLEIGLIDALLSDPNFSLPELIATFRRSYPLVDLSISTATSNVIEQSVLDGGVHAGLVIGRRHINQLDYRLLYRERSNLYCSEKHPLYGKLDATFEEILKYDFAGYTFLSECERFHLHEFPRTASVDTMEAVALLVCSGNFLGSLPDHYVESHWRLQKLKPLLPGTFGYTTDIEFITRKNATSPLVMALMDIIDTMRVTTLPDRKKAIGAE